MIRPGALLLLLSVVAGGCLFDVEAPTLYRCGEASPDCPAGFVCVNRQCLPSGDAGNGRCGDGVRQGNEQCDSADLAGQTCAKLCFGPGKLSCDKQCRLDASACGLPSSWVKIAPGSLAMGSPTDEPGRESNEPQHSVKLSRGFFVWPTEVTQNQFVGLMGYNPSLYVCKAHCPVEQVKWREAAAYCNALSDKEGLERCYEEAGQDCPAPQYMSIQCPLGLAKCKKTKCAAMRPASKFATAIRTCPGYRLPTEAEWEYAYRAGSKTAFYDGPITLVAGMDPVADRIGWFRQNAHDAAANKPLPMEVAQKRPNRWCLFDMAGNVWEHCHDYFASSLGTQPATDPQGPALGNSRSLRGGSYWDQPTALRAARRRGIPAQDQNSAIGFRCVRSAPLP